MTNHYYQDNFPSHKTLPLVNLQKTMKYHHCLIGKSTISMAMFNVANCECLPGRVSPSDIELSWESNHWRNPTSPGGGLFLRGT